jgi:nitrogen fixation protein NifB
MADMPAPSCAQIERARASAEKHIAVFRHCQHCRADAIGIPGGPDITEQVYAIRGSSGTPRATRPLAANTFSHG